jgi:hypothetical protein
MQPRGLRQCAQRFVAGTTAAAPRLTAECGRSMKAARRALVDQQRNAACMRQPDQAIHIRKVTVIIGAGDMDGDDIRIFIQPVRTALTSTAKENALADDARRDEGGFERISPAYTSDARRETITFCPSRAAAISIA